MTWDKSHRGGYFFRTCNWCLNSCLGIDGNLINFGGLQILPRWKFVTLVFCIKVTEILILHYNCNLNLDYRHKK